MSGDVRPASQRDLDRVTELWMALGLHQAALEQRHALRVGAEIEVRKLVAAELRDRDALVLLYDGVAGACGLCMARIQRPPPIWRDDFGLRVEIGELFVLEGARRQGIGRALVGAALEWARAAGADSVVVRVGAANRVGQAFWRGLGFAASMDVLERRL